jgi:hypothetical protein
MDAELLDVILDPRLPMILVAGVCQVEGLAVLVLARGNQVVNPGQFVLVDK